MFQALVGLAENPHSSPPQLVSEPAAEQVTAIPAVVNKPLNLPSSSAAQISPLPPLFSATLPRTINPNGAKGLKINIPDRRAFASPCASPTGTIR